MNCTQCGGNDFYMESGFYYCNECQTQSQEIQEHAADNQQTERNINFQTETTRKTRKKTKNERKLTSWECYNYIILGLTNELIELGANENLKQIVKIIWLMYLERLQVFKRDGDANLPRLQAVNNRKDAEIIYGKRAKFKRRRSGSVKSSSTESEATTTNSSTTRSSRLKKKRALIQANYTMEMLDQSNATSPSLQNETLSSLKADSDKLGQTKKIPVKYNIYAVRELNKQQTMSHRLRHQRDYHNVLSCHQPTYKQSSASYSKSIHILSPNKLYAIIYLGLLISRDQIQLGDMLKLMKFGFLTINDYTKFFENLNDEEEEDKRNLRKVLNFSTKTGWLTHNGIRQTAYDLVEFLKIKKYCKPPNLIHVIERYCYELNLPKTIVDLIKILISRDKMRLRWVKGKLPNYEGRCLSLILFVLKLFYSFDDLTEFELNKFAINLNQINNDEIMFEIIDWLKYLELRKFVIGTYHFPSNFVQNSAHISNIELYLNFLGSNREDLYKFDKKLDDYQHVFDQLINKTKSHDLKLNRVDFRKTLTPFRDYTQLIIDNNLIKNSDLIEILSKKFQKQSLNYLLKPEPFLKLLKVKERVNGVANSNWVVEEFETYNQHVNSGKELLSLNLTFDECDEIGNNQPTTPSTTTSSSNRVEINSENFRNNFFKTHENQFKLNRKKLEEVSYFSDLKNKLPKIRSNYSKHYNSFESYWLLTRIGIENYSKCEMMRFLKKFPGNFRLVFEEFCRICEQPPKELFEEFQLTETYLVYLAHYQLPKNKKKFCSNKFSNIRNASMRNFLESVQKCW